jgi:hypothetical protein
MQEQHDTIVNALVWGTLAGFGGMVKYISTVIRSSDLVSNQRFVVLLAANAFISSFCGLMGGLLLTTVTDERGWQYLASGIFGYLGTTGLDFILIALKKKIDPSFPVSAIIPMPANPDAIASQHRQ